MSLIISCEKKTEHSQHLKDTAHPLEAVFLRGVWSLLCHNNNPLIMKHRHRKHSYPGTHIIKHCYRWSTRFSDKTVCRYDSLQGLKFNSECFFFYLPLYTNFIGSTASAVATTSSALCLRPLTTISPSIFPTTNTRLSWWETQSTHY